MTCISRLSIALCFCAAGMTASAQTNITLQCNVSDKGKKADSLLMVVYPDVRRVEIEGKIFTEQGVPTQGTSLDTRFDKILSWNDSSITFGDAIYKNGNLSDGHVYHYKFNRLTGNIAKAYIGGSYYSEYFSGTCVKVDAAKRVF